MKFEITLPDPTFCNGCPCCPEVYDGSSIGASVHCAYKYGALYTTAPGKRSSPDRVFRPAKCIEENGE